MLFSSAVKKVKISGRIPVIPDFKPVSPKEGELFGKRDPIEVARLFEELGAPCISVVTEPENFGGSMELLEKLVRAVSLPVLRKDFIRRADQVKETAAAGAGAVLLICGCMSETELIACYQAAMDWDIEPLVEVHTEGEMQAAARLGARLVGVNNRDIGVLEKDSGTVARTQALAALAPAQALLISESGIETCCDVRKAVLAGADGVLVGTALWKAQDIEKMYLRLSEAAR